MSIPSRVKLGSPFSFTFGQKTAAAMAFAVVIIVVIHLISLPTISRYLDWFIVLVVCAIIGSFLDTKSRTSKDLDAFKSLGYDQIQPNELAQSIRESLRTSKPTQFLDGHFKEIQSGVHRNREVVFIRLIDSSSGESHAELSCCAIWSPLIFPKSLIRRKGLKDKVDLFRDAKEHQIGSQHILETKNLHMIPLLEQMYGWFEISRSKIDSFKFQVSNPVDRESWMFNDHWIIYYSLGRASPEAFLELANYVSVFANQIESISGFELEDMNPT